MKATIKVREFREAFGLASSCTARNLNTPILTCVQLLAGSRQILRATNGEQSIEVAVEIDCQSPGTTLLPAAKMQSILAATVADELQLSASEGKVKIVASGSRFEFSTYPGELPWHDAQCSEFVELPVHVVLAAIDRTAFATDPNSNRYALGGVLFAADDGTFNFVSTDTRRMSVVSVECKGSVQDSIVPLKAVQAIKAIAKAGKMLMIGTTPNSVVVRCDGIAFQSRLVEGRFPQWGPALKAFRDDSPNEIEVPAGVLIEASSQAALAMSSDKDAARSMDVEISESEIAMSAVSSDEGEASIKVPLGGSQAKFSVDGDYLRDGLKSFGREELVKFNYGECYLIMSSGQYTHAIRLLDKD